MIDASLFKFVVEADIDKALDTMRGGWLERFELTHHGRYVVVHTSPACDVTFHTKYVLEMIEDAIWSGK